MDVGAVTDEVTFAEILAVLIRKVLECSEEEVANILLKRCKATDDERSELMKSEEAEAVLDREDQQECASHAKATSGHMSFQHSIMDNIRNLKAVAARAAKKSQSCQEGLARG